MWGQFKNVQTLDSYNFHDFFRSQQHATTWKWVVKFVLGLEREDKSFSCPLKTYHQHIFKGLPIFFCWRPPNFSWSCTKGFFQLTVLSKTFMGTFIKILTVLGQIRTLSSVHEWAGCRNIGSIHNFSKWHLFKFQKAHFIPSTQQTFPAATRLKLS